MQIPDTDTSEYAALIELAATGGRIADPRVAAFAAFLSPAFWKKTPTCSTGLAQRSDSRPGHFSN